MLSGTSSHYTSESRWQGVGYSANWDLQSLCSKWHSSPVFLTNTECCQGWSWQWGCGDQAGPEEHHCAFHQNGIQMLYRVQATETACIQERSSITFLTMGMSSKPCWNPWHWSKCCKPFPWVKASKAARWFPWVSRVCTACSQSPKWGRGAASRFCVKIATCINHHLQGRCYKLLSTISGS